MLITGFQSLCQLLSRIKTQSVQELPESGNGRYLNTNKLNLENIYREKLSQ